MDFILGFQQTRSANLSLSLQDMQIRIIAINSSYEMKTAARVRLETAQSKPEMYKPAQTVSIVCYYKVYFNPVDLGYVW